MFGRMTRTRHPNKEVEAVIRLAEGLGWVCRAQGHWERLYSPRNDRDGCQIGISGTPRNADAHARQIRRALIRCPNRHEEARDEDV